MDPELAEWLRQASTWVLPVLVAITFHEAAHGFVAWRLGDDTAYRLGRVTFNPIRHVDLFGTIILPALLLLVRSPVLFGYAKPVPVRFGQLRDPRSGMILVAAAGPATNLVLAVASAALVHVALALPTGVGEWAGFTLMNSLQLNLVLAVFNMLPLPPLDGGRVAVGLLPAPLAVPLARLERYGMVIVMAALFLLPWLGARLGTDLDIFYWIVHLPVQWAMWVILGVVGLT